MDDMRFNRRSLFGFLLFPLGQLRRNDRLFGM